ncbi:MAG: hypothetical protein HC923_08265 [Myxococcales bacterium]|nr:hypothetical protein [Myxococcales bacterium]
MERALCAGAGSEPAKRGPGTATDNDCLVCHAGTGEEEAPKLDLGLYGEAAHHGEGCIGCHTDVFNPDIAHEEEDQDLAPVACETCHSDADEHLSRSIHRDEEAAKDSEHELPKCSDCHGNHDVFPAQHPRSRLHPVNQRAVCGECHAADREGGGHRLAAPADLESVVSRADPEVIYRLMNMGKLVSASCTDCHGAHDILPESDPGSPLHPSKITDTCGKCHNQISKRYAESAHAKASEAEGFEWKLLKRASLRRSTRTVCRKCPRCAAPAMASTPILHRATHAFRRTSSPSAGHATSG